MSIRHRRHRRPRVPTWLRRACLQLWPARSPICRRSDRIEATVLRAASAALLAATAVGVLLGAHAAARAEHTARLARARSHPVDVVLVHAASSVAVVSRQTSDVGATVPTLGRWHTATGTRTGTVDVDVYTPAGAHVTVWFDSRWRQTTQPESRLGTVMDGVGPGLCPPLSVAAAGAIAVVVTRYRLNRRRLRDWEAEWRRVEPIWSHRPRRDHHT